MSNVGDYEDMAKNAIYILEDENRLMEFKASAYAQAKTFNIDNILPQYEAYYEKVIRYYNDLEFMI